jgi:5-methylcytosine-specific restriction endonuclease McrA
MISKNVNEKALFICGAFQGVLEEIMAAQEHNPGKVFYLQPYSESTITQFKKEPPNHDAPWTVYISITGGENINHIWYAGQIVGWNDKQALSEDELVPLNDHIREFQPKEGNIYLKNDNGKDCKNLIHIINLKRLSNRRCVTNLVLQDSGVNHELRGGYGGGFAYVWAQPQITLDLPLTKVEVHNAERAYVKQILKDVKGDMDELKRRADSTPDRSDPDQVKINRYHRSPAVVAYVLSRADGICEMCDNNAPFLRASDGTPYLEVHHIIPLSRGGKDKPYNARALCPNCHAKEHYGQKKEQKHAA